MIYGRYVRSKTYVLHWFFNGFVQIVFFQKVGPQDQQSSVFGAQNDPESELWADISGPKIDENSGLKKEGPKSRKVTSKSKFLSSSRDVPDPFGIQGSSETNIVFDY